MKQIGITEVRKILLEALSGYTGLCEGIASMPDEKLLKTNLCNEFGMDSLDFEDMFNELYNLYGIVVDIHYPLIEYPFNKEQTVENFIDTVNNYHLSIRA
ncbi:MAG: hypothetical protein J6N45_01195 [Alphaproteobacteria bacterium]|nr:hypothetical protein [Alphaproteobacteria bacterium]